jgi:biopolymer transport protein ExbD
MAIVAPGKHPSPRIAQSKVFGKRFEKGRRKLDSDLMITSLIDVFVILVLYLIQNFSATGEILFMSADIHLPAARHGVQIQRAPVIAVSADAITFEGARVVSMVDVERSDILNIPALEDALRESKRVFEMVRSQDPESQHKGDVNIQADKRVQFKILKRVMFSCNQAGYSNINFAAMEIGSGGEAAAAKPAEGT